MATDFASGPANSRSRVSPAALHSTVLAAANPLDEPVLGRPDPVGSLGLPGTDDGRGAWSESGGWRRRGRIRTPLALVLIVVAVLVAAGHLLSGRQLIIIATAMCLAHGGFTLRARGGWLAPTGMPLLYAVAVHTVPLAMSGRYVFADQPATVANGIVSPEMADDATLRALGLFLIGLLAGAALIGVHTASPMSLRRRLDKPLVDGGDSLVMLGRFGLCAAILLQAVYFARNGVSRAASGALDVELTTMGRIALFIGVVATAAAAGQRSGSSRSLRRWDLLLTVAALLLATTWGSRSTLLAPILIIAFTTAVRRHDAGRRLLVGAAVGALVFVVIAETRISGTDGLEDFGTATVVERMVRDINAPTYLTYYTLEALAEDSSAEPANGSSYAAAVPRLLPSVIVDTVGWRLAPLGTQQYRDLIGFDNPDRNFGYAAVAEGVLNFGIAGALAAGLALGAALGLSYRWLVTGQRSSLAARWLYPIMFASAPWIMRSDALQASKPIVYAIAGLAGASWLAASRSKSPRPPSMVELDLRPGTDAVDDGDYRTRSRV